MGSCCKNTKFHKALNCLEKDKNYETKSRLNEVKAFVSNFNRKKSSLICSSV